MKFKSRTWRGDILKYAHEKLDGHWTRIEKSASGAVTITTSRPTDITDALSQYPFSIAARTLVPCGTTIFGELYVPGTRASSVKTFIKDGDLRLRFKAFAVETMPEEASLEEVEAACKTWGIEFAPYLVSPHNEWPPPIKLGAEGWMFKDGNLLNWQKYKTESTIDLIIDRFTDGDGKYLGLIGSIVCRTTEGHIVANASGMSDEERVDMTLNEEKYLGAVVELEYQYVGSRGRLRHPRFVRFRDDKSSEECSVDQDSTLEKIWRTQQ